MNPMTGELYANNEANKEFFKKLTEVPERLRAEAEAKLAGRDRAMTDISDDSELSEWAREQRKYQTEKPSDEAAQRRLRQMERELAKAEK
jgi:hypothetical protein